MIHVEQSIVIQRPLEDVFTFVANPGNDAQWNAPIRATRLTSAGPVGVGTTFEHDVEFMGRRFVTTVEITEYVLNQQACVRTVGGPLQSWGCRTVAAVDGSTRLTVRLEGQMRGVLKLGEAVAGVAARQQLETGLARLKALLESQG